MHFNMALFVYTVIWVTIEDLASTIKNDTAIRISWPLLKHTKYKLCFISGYQMPPLIVEFYFLSTVKRTC